MNCRDIEELLMQYAFDELSEEELDSIESHLEQCEHCTAELKKNQAVYRFTKKLRESAPYDKNRAGSISTIIKELDPAKQEPVYRLMPNRIVRWSTSAAAIFLVGLFLVQQVEMKQSLKNLEAKMHQRVNTASPLTTDYIIPEITSLSEDKIILLIKEYHVAY